MIPCCPLDTKMGMADDLGQYQAETDQSRYNVSYPVFVGTKYDASTTNLTYQIPSPSPNGYPLELTVSFLSPITPTSTLRQSIPASYVTVYVQGDFDVNVYIDVNGQWVSGDRGSQIVWGFDHLVAQGGESSSLKKWQVKRQGELLLSEINDRAEWGTLHFVGPAVSIVRKCLTGISNC